MTVSFEPDRGYQLNPDVALRPEPFGALAALAAADMIVPAERGAR